MADDVVDIDFNGTVPGAFVSTPGTATVSGTLAVDYTTSTTTGTLTITANGFTETYTNPRVQSGKNDSHEIDARGDKDPNSNEEEIVWTGDTPSSVSQTITQEGAVYKANEPVSSTVACYAAGTLIHTSRGNVAVEDLAIGDLVVTASGVIRPIRWLGQRSYIGRFANANPDVLPVCFKAGSLAENVPARDLRVSPKHAMFLDGVLVAAEHLVNGVTVTKATRVERIDYFHVELDSHDVLLAEGAPSESFIDDDSRRMFRNAAEFAALHPLVDANRAVHCSPRVDQGMVLQAIRLRIDERVEALSSVA